MKWMRLPLHLLPRDLEDPHQNTDNKKVLHLFSKNSRIDFLVAAAKSKLLIQVYSGCVRREPLINFAGVSSVDTSASALQEVCAP